MHACMYATVTGNYGLTQLLPFHSLSCRADSSAACRIQDVDELHNVMLGKIASQSAMFWLQIDLFSSVYR